IVPAVMLKFFKKRNLCRQIRQSVLKKHAKLANSPNYQKKFFIMAGETIKDYEAQIVQLSIEKKEELENFRLKWLSKKGLLAQLFSAMKDIPAEERKEYGQKVNELKDLAEEKFTAFKEKIERQEAS